MPNVFAPSYTPSRGPSASLVFALQLLKELAHHHLATMHNVELCRGTADLQPRVISALTRMFIFSAGARLALELSADSFKKLIEAGIAWARAPQASMCVVH